MATFSRIFLRFVPRKRVQESFFFSLVTTSGSTHGKLYTHARLTRAPRTETAHYHDCRRGPGRAQPLLGRLSVHPSPNWRFLLPSGVFSNSVCHPYMVRQPPAPNNVRSIYDDVGACCSPALSSRSLYPWSSHRYGSQSGLESQRR